jgi:hypothetical protein
MQELYYLMDSSIKRLEALKKPKRPKPTQYNKEELRGLEIISYDQGRRCKTLTLENFREVFWLSDSPSHINAVAYTDKGSVKILKLRKRK